MRTLADHGLNGLNGARCRLTHEAVHPPDPLSVARMRYLAFRAVQAVQAVDGPQTPEYAPLPPNPVSGRRAVTATFRAGRTVLNSEGRVRGAGCGRRSRGGLRPARSWIEPFRRKGAQPGVHLGRRDLAMRSCRPRRPGRRAAAGSGLVIGSLPRPVQKARAVGFRAGTRAQRKRAGFRRLLEHPVERGARKPFEAHAAEQPVSVRQCRQSDPPPPVLAVDATGRPFTSRGAMSKVLRKLSRKRIPR